MPLLKTMRLSHDVVFNYMFCQVFLAGLYTRTIFIVQKLVWTSFVQASLSRKRLLVNLCSTQKELKLVKSKRFKENLVVCAALKQKYELPAVFEIRHGYIWGCTILNILPLSVLTRALKTNNFRSNSLLTAFSDRYYRIVFVCPRFKRRTVVATI